jgi:hypothetical protein
VVDPAHLFELGISDNLGAHTYWKMRRNQAQ